MLDEVQTFQEHNFRDVMKRLSLLGLLDIPILTLSGSIHSMLLPTVFKKFNLYDKNFHDNINLIKTDEIVGSFPNRFEFNVIEKVNSRCDTLKKIKLLLKKEDQYKMVFP